SFPWMESDVT
uniref:Thyroliberin potentiating neuropeptide n=1 Tax=Bos taurus TaxID=9913 RepID=Q7M2Z8_BOVIN